MTKKVDVQDFALRVERLCNFLLAQIETKDGSNDLKIIEDLKNDAANLQFDRSQMGSEILVDGLFDYMKGAPSEPRS